MSKNMYLSASIVTNPGKEIAAGPVYVILDSVCHLAEMQPARQKEIGNRIMAAMAKDVSLPYGDYYLSMQEISERECLAATGALEDGDEKIIEELFEYEASNDVRDALRNVSEYARMLAKTTGDNEEFRMYTRLATIIEEAMTKQVVK